MNPVYWLLMGLKRRVCSEEVRVLLEGPVYLLVVELDSWVWSEEVRVVEGWRGPGLYYMENLYVDPVYWLV